MNNAVFNIIINFLLIGIFQVFVLNNLVMFGWATPYVYPLFILLIPIRFPKSLLVILAFLFGFIIDLFSNTGGLHAASLLVTAILRGPVLKLLRPVEGYELEDKPTLIKMGFTWFLFYTLLLLIPHHIIFVILEVLNFGSLAYITGKIILSSLVAVVLIILIQFLSFPGSIRKFH